MKRPDDAAKTSDSKRMTRADVAARLGVSTSTVRRYEGDALHPTKGADGINRFDPREVAELAAKLVAEKPPKAERTGARNAKPAQPERTPGEIAAEVFHRFEQRQSLAEIVIGVRVPPALVRDLHREWQRGLGEGELDQAAPVLQAGSDREAHERPVDEGTLSALLAALPARTPTRISVARDLGAEYEIDAGSVRRVVELGGFLVRGAATIDDIVARYGHGSYRVTAYALDPPGLRWEVLVPLRRPPPKKPSR